MKQIQPIRWGSFRRGQPYCSYWGLERGRPIDRYYIEKFLAEQRNDIKGNCIEMENPGYSLLYGEDRVEHVDVLDISSENRKATIISDISAYHNMPEGKYDCFILTQTLQLVFDLRGAIRSAYRLLKPGGVVLATVPGITPIPVRDQASKQWCWSFTANSMAKLFQQEFSPSKVHVSSYGNVLSATSFLWGLSQDDLTREELDWGDPDYQVIVAVRVEK